jgi:uncharacterized protein
MKIIVVSDSHGRYQELQDIALKNYDATLFLHLGDYELPDYLLHSYTCVRGNCDFSIDAPLKRDLDYPFGRIHMEHGNYIDYHNFSKYIANTHSFIFLFGHTHEKFFKKINDTYVFNPGSISRPRDSDKGSYLIIDINEKTLEVTHRFVDVDL